MVFDALQDWLITTIVKKATIKLISMFNPAGAIIQAILLIYDTVTFLIENATKILQFVEAVIDSVAAIAAGNIASAANWIEQALGRMVPILIGFLAQLLGLGGIGKKIREFITKVQDFVDKAIDKAIAKVVGIVKKLLGGGKDAKPDNRTEEQKADDLKKAVAEAKALDVKERPPKKLAKALARIKDKYRLTDLSMTLKEDVASIHAAVNPEIVFEIESKDVSDIGKKVFQLAQPGFSALPASAAPSAAETILKNALKELKLKKANLEFEPQDVKTTGTHAQVYLFAPEYGLNRELIGAIWNIRKLFVPREGPGAATKFKNQKTNAPAVRDAGGQFVQRYVIRDINAEDRKALDKRRGITARNPKAKRYPELRHSMGQVEKSPFISTSKLPETEKIVSKNLETGEEKSFYTPEHGRVRIDLDFIKAGNLRDLSTRVGQDLWNFSDPGSDKAKQALADVIRTKEVLVKGEIPPEAIELIAGPA
jgi:hypothetical protein